MRSTTTTAASPEGAIAHVLRRLAFGPAPWQAEVLAVATDARTLALAMVEDAADRRSDEPVLDTDDADGELMRWWIRRMEAATDDLHERMVWYWHGHLTSSLSKAKASAMWGQHLLLRRHALGNFRDLLQAVSFDAAMLWFLDGAWSTKDAANENFARELMELFTLGPGNYTEDDVRAAARVFTGWWVEWETDEVGFDASTAYDRPVSVFGIRKRWRAEDLIDTICAKDACAPFVARRLYRHLVGVDPAPERLASLADGFRASGLEIRPLVREIVTGDDFHAAVRSRPRTGLEWLVAALRILGHTPEDDVDPWWAMQLGQVPFRPPNVAGWPEDARWLGANQVLLRANTLLGFELPPHVVDGVEPTVPAVLAHCGLHDVSDATRSTLEQALSAQGEYAHGLDLLIALALLSPEFALA